MKGWRPAALNQGWIYTDRMKGSESGQMLSAVMASRYAHSPRDVWDSRIRTGELLLNGQSLQNDVPVGFRDVVQWRRPPWLEPAIPDQWSVVYDDGDVLVINKPSGLPVMPGGGFLQHTLSSLLVETSRSAGASQAPKPVHRLGRFTSGLQVCARRPQTRARLSREFRPEGGCRKTYLAWTQPVAGLRADHPLVVTTDVVERCHPLLGWVWGPDPRDAETPRRRLPARSELCLLKRCDQGDLVEVAISTGRPHQIRIHLAQLGAPLLGDPLYLPQQRINTAAVPGDGGYLLHAHTLVFENGLHLSCEAGSRFTPG
nr:RNA pseudouridine synthase [Synechococcus sp. PROS-7-1]